MPLYRCSKCGCVENTALGGYWRQGMVARNNGVEHLPLCSECDPEIGKWHGRFEKSSTSKHSLVDSRGFLYTPVEAEQMPHMGPFREQQ